ncbi:uncharacterized protein [Battus philenor]|uniref:uncharacterized protein n=1 Tax=Battus philenor TaxID=42288 RepID=UPI0035CF85A4
MIEFDVKTLDSQNHHFAVEDGTTVQQLKELISERMSLEVNTLRLIFHGKVLQDENKLTDYGVDGMVMHLVQREPPSRDTRQYVPSIMSPGGSSSSDYAFDSTTNRTYRQFDESENDTQEQIRELMALSSPESIMTEEQQALTLSPTAGRLEMIRRAITDIKTGIIQLRAHIEQSGCTVMSPNGQESVVESAEQEASNNAAPQDQPLLDEFGDDINDPAARTTNLRRRALRNLRSRRDCPRDLAGLFEELEVLHMRFTPHRVAYMNLLSGTRPRVYTDAERATRQRTVDLTCDILHSFSHAYHAISDITYQISQPSPRLFSEMAVLGDQNFLEEEVEDDYQGDDQSREMDTRASSFGGVPANEASTSSAGAAHPGPPQNQYNPNGRNFRCRVEIATIVQRRQNPQDPNSPRELVYRRDPTRHQFYLDLGHILRGVSQPTNVEVVMNAGEIPQSQALESLAEIALSQNEHNLAFRQNQQNVAHGQNENNVGPGQNEHNIAGNQNQQDGEAEVVFDEIPWCSPQNAELIQEMVQSIMQQLPDLNNPQIRTPEGLQVPVEIPISFGPLFGRNSSEVNVERESVQSTSEQTSFTATATNSTTATASAVDAPANPVISLVSPSPAPISLDSPSPAPISLDSPSPPPNYPYPSAPEEEQAGKPNAGPTLVDKSTATIPMVSTATQASDDDAPPVSTLETPSAFKNLARSHPTQASSERQAGDSDMNSRPMHQTVINQSRYSPNIRLHRLPAQSRAQALAALSSTVYDRFLPCDNMHSRCRLQRRREEQQHEINAVLRLRAERVSAMNIRNIRLRGSSLSDDQLALLERMLDYPPSAASWLNAFLVAVARQLYSPELMQNVAGETPLVPNEFPAVRSLLRSYVHYLLEASGADESANANLDVANYLMASSSQFISRLVVNPPLVHLRLDVDVVSSITSLLRSRLPAIIAMLTSDSTSEIYPSRFYSIFGRLFIDMVAFIRSCAEDDFGTRLIYTMFMGHVAETGDVAVDQYLRYFSQTLFDHIQPFVENSVDNIRSHVILFPGPVVERRSAAFYRNGEPENTAPSVPPNTPRPRSRPQARSQTRSQIRPQIRPQHRPQLQPQPQPQPQPRPQPQPQPQPQSQPPPPSRPTTVTVETMTDPVVISSGPVPHTTPPAGDTATVGTNTDHEALLTPTHLRRVRQQPRTSSAPKLESTQTAADTSSVFEPRLIVEHWGDDYVPMFSLDQTTQRGRQSPYSDAYLSNMPSHKRRRVRSSRPPTNLDGFINESYGEAANNDVVRPEETTLRTAVREHIRDLGRSRADGSEDFQPQRLSNAEHFFRTSSHDEQESSQNQEEPEQEQRGGNDEC